MAAEPLFGRMIPAMVTPFDERGDVDVAQAVALARRLVERGASAVLVFGTTGESPTVDASDKLVVLRAIASELAGAAPVIANVGTNSTSASVAFAKQAAQCGVDGLMAVCPYYNKPPQEGLYRHFRAIAQAADLPLVMYNIPGRCSVNMLAATTLRLARDVPNIVAVKEASGDLDQIEAVCQGAPEGFAVYSGDDALTYDVMKRGGAGVISTTGNCAPSAMRKIVDLCAAGLWEQAESANEQLMPLMKGLFATTNPILVKAALNLQGFPVGGLRLPLVDATPEQADRLAQVMRQVGVLD